MAEQEVQLAIHSNGLDNYPGVAFIADRDTLKILFLNRTGRELLHVTNDEVINKLTCKELGLHYESLCKHCPIGKAKPNVFLNMKNYNPKLGNYFSYLIYPYEKGGRNLFISFARNNTQEVKIHVEAKRKEIAEEALNNAMLKAMDQSNFDVSIQIFLTEIGTYFRAGRAIIYERQSNGTFTNSYFWSKKKGEKKVPDIPPELFNDFIASFYQTFDKGKEVIVNDISIYEKTYPKLYALLQEYHTKSFLLKPISYDGNRYGYFGLADIPPEDIQMFHEIISTACNVLGLFLVQRETQKKLFSLVYEDPLTKTKNRHGLDQFLEKKKEPVTYFYSDINGLKETNDLLGHQAGDKLVQNCASILMSHFGKENVYRMGGDEFLSISKKMNDTEAEDLIHTIKNEVHHIHASMALSTLTEKSNKENFDKNFVLLDKRMYVDKERHHKNCPSEKPYLLKEEN